MSDKVYPEDKPYSDKFSRDKLAAKSRVAKKKRRLAKKRKDKNSWPSKK